MPENTPNEMPGGIGMSVHYDSYGEFQRSQAEMAEDGWTLEGYALVGERRGLGRFFGGGKQAVDAHYLRSNWPTE